MSRGPGKTERAALEAVHKMGEPSTNDVACYVYNVALAEDLTLAQQGSVQRALRRLKARGEVDEQVPARASIWRLRTRRSTTRRRQPTDNTGAR